MFGSSNKKNKIDNVILNVFLVSIILAFLMVVFLPTYYKAVLLDFFSLNPSTSTIPRRPMHDLRRIGTAVEAYKIDYGFYPRVGSMEELSQILCPRFMDSFPTRDVYGNNYKYQAWKDDATLPGPDNYAIGCSGRDGKWEYDDLKEYEQKPIHNIKADLVFRNGFYIQWLDGPLH